LSALWGNQSFADIMSSGGAIVPLLLGVALWEVILPEHRTVHPFVSRWASNFSLFAISVMLSVVLAPSLAFLTNVALEHSPFRWSPGDMGFWLHLLFAFVVLDGLNYATHRAYHAVPALWRLHAAHHTDLTLDVSTTVRHHPLEAIVSAVVVGIAGALLGCSAIEVAAYGVVENVIQLVAHADVRLPSIIERALSAIFVTPKFHRIHHSSERVETDSNYGQVFVVWDRLLGSYRGYADDKRGAIEFGLDKFRDRRSQRLDQLLLLPLRAVRTADDERIT
jgi:sterol desaturase/sphingolipid hydroxylase (fatty acid hydroxylase superfamily)